MKKIFKYIGIILTVALTATFTGCTLDEQLESADVGLHVKVFFPTKVVKGQPMTINGSGFADATEIVFPGEVVVTDFKIVSNDMIRVNAPAGIAAEGGKIIVRTPGGEAESPLPLTLGETKISGYSAVVGTTVTGGDKSATLTVTQKGQEVVVPETELTILTPSVEVEAAGGNFTIEVSANVEYTVTVTEGAEWLTKSSDLGFTAAENTSTESRTATITVSGGDKTATLTVTQKGKEVVPTPPASDDDMTLDDIPVVPGDWA